MTKSFSNPINESAYEDAIISIFKDLGYRHVLQSPYSLNYPVT